MKKNDGSVKITTPSDRELSMTRVFNAPARLVYDANTKPEFLKRWLGVFDGWSLAVCEVDLRVGGLYRWVWRDAKKGDMGMGGEYLEITPNQRLVATEKFDDAWYDGRAVVTTTFSEDAGKTTLVSTMLYDSKVIRDKVLASGMEHGVAASYDALDGVLTSLVTAA